MKALRTTVAGLVGLLLVLASFVPSASAADSVVTVADTADMYTTSSTPTTNNGKSTSLGVYGTPSNTAFLRFVLPAAPAGKALSGVRLRVRTTNIESAGSANAVNVRAAADTWNETTTTHNTRPSVTPAILGTLPGGSGADRVHWISLDAAALAARTGSTTLALQGTGTDSLWIWSRRHANSGYRPLLELTWSDVAPTDGVPPSAPADLAAQVTGSSVNLAWSPSSDNVAVTGYTVHRSTSADFTPTSGTAIGPASGASYVDLARPAGTWHYRVVAKDAAGNASDPSADAEAVVTAVAQEEKKVNLLPTADTFTHASTPTANNGASASMGVYGTPNVTALLRFALPAPPAGKVLTGARLRLTTSNIASSGTVNLTHVRTAADTWTESTTYPNRPALGTASLGTLAGGSVPSTAYWAPVDVAALPSGAGSLSLALQGTGNDSLWIWSRNAPDPSTRPSLELTYVGDAQPPVPPEPLEPTDPTATSTVVAAGDLVCPPGTTVAPETCKHAEVRTLMDSLAPDRFIAVGDLAQGQSALSEWMAQGRYHDTFGDLVSKTLPIVGNHEAYDPNADGYWNYFYGPGVTTGRLGQRPYGWYTAVIGSWRFIALNSECDAGGLAEGCDASSEQYKWLKSVLERDTTACTIVGFHRPRWTTGNGHQPYTAMAPMWDLMAEHGVDIALSGHNHVAEAFKPIGVSGTAAQPTLSPTGIRDFTVGIGGASQVGFNAVGAGQFGALESRARGTFGLLKLQLRPDGYDWGFEPIAGRTFTNSGTTGSFSGTDSCH